MHIRDYARAQGWFRKHAAAPSSVGSWKAFVARNNRAQEPRTMADGERTGFELGGDVQAQILEKFPNAKFSTEHQYGFSKKDPNYEKVRGYVRRVTGKTKEYEAKRKNDPVRQEYKRRIERERPAEYKAAKLEKSKLKYHTDSKARASKLAQSRKYITQPEIAAKRKKYMQKRYYTGGQREKDLIRLRGKALSENLGSYLQNPDNALLKDMIRASKTDSNIKLIRGGPDNTVVAVQEGNKIYHAVGAKRAPVEGAPKNSTSIIKHPGFKKRADVVKQQKEFKHTKVPGKDITYGEALDVLESKKAKTPIQNKNPAEYEHVKGVAEDYKKGQIALRTANREKQVIMSALKNGHITKAEAGRQLKKIGVRAFIDGKYIGAPKIKPEKQFKDLKNM